MPIPLGIWELDLYVGLVGAIFLIYFGLWRWLRVYNDHPGFHSLALPVLGLVVLSIGRIYELIRMTHIPLLEGERVSARIISLPFVFILIFAVNYFQDWLDKPHRNPTLIFTILGSVVIISMNDLWQNYRIWRVTEVVRNLKQVDFDPRLWIVANRPDPVYLGFILAGATLSLVSLGVLLYFIRKSRQQTD